ncbi:hypothetical protein BY996DRAFT_6422858 [Phakopsora pachyrhizi]|nr:hypothetical protein BY996DRAFT_6422858 [Phakopsora pachyrhizi]
MNGNNRSYHSQLNRILVPTFDTTSHNSSPATNSNLRNATLKRTASKADLPQTNSLKQSRCLQADPHVSRPCSEPTILEDNNSFGNCRPVDEQMNGSNILIKHENTTPCLPPQPLPDLMNSNWPDSHSPRSLQRHSTSSSSPSGSEPQGPQTRPNSLAERRVTITDERAVNNLLRSGSVAQNQLSNQLSSSAGANGHDMQTKLSVDAAHDPVAATMKLREEQKRLIEQRRNSIAGPASLSAYQFNPKQSLCDTEKMPPPASGAQHRSPPSIARASVRRSLGSKPAHNSCTSGLSSTGQQTPLSHSSQVSNPLPVVSLPPINETGRRKSTQNHQNHQSNHSSLSHTVSQSSTQNSPCNDSEFIESEHPSMHLNGNMSGSTIANRRSQATREKVKNLAIAPQAFRSHLIAQPSIKSAPIRCGFLQSTAPDGEVVKTPLIARTNLATSGSGTKIYPARKSAREGSSLTISKIHSKPLHPPNTSQLPARPFSGTASVGPGASNARQIVGGTNASQSLDRTGLERRMTMHSGVPLQLPTLSHIPIFNADRSEQTGPASLQANRSTGYSGSSNGNAESSSFQASLLSGPRTAMPAFGGSPQDFSGLRSSANGSSGQLSASSSQHPFPFRPSPTDRPYFMPGSRYHRPSVASGGSAGSSALGIPPKNMFLQLFDTFYDSLSDSKILQSNLEDQIRRSAQLLNLLQQSSGVFEKMLDDRVRVIQTEYTRDLQLLEGRIEKLENQSALSADRSVESPPSSPHDRKLNGRVSIASQNPEPKDYPANRFGDITEMLRMFVKVFCGQLSRKRFFQDWNGWRKKYQEDM